MAGPTWTLASAIGSHAIWVTTRVPTARRILRDAGGVTLAAFRQLLPISRKQDSRWARLPAGSRHSVRDHADSRKQNQAGVPNRTQSAREDGLVDQLSRC